MAYNIQYFIIIIVATLIFLTYTFAPWIQRPVVPSDDTFGTCVYWLYYHSFTDDNVENRRRAYYRRQQYDEDVSYFAAGYAYLLTNESQLYSIAYLGPSQYCERHTPSNVTYPYIALKDAEFTCEGWIDFYIYTVDRRRVDQHLIWADKRSKSMDNIMPIWPALYFRHITSLHAYYRDPKSYCNVMDKPVTRFPLPKNYPFLTLNGTKMSCKECEEIKNSPDLRENIIFEENSTTVTKLPFATLGPKKTCTDWIIQCGFSDDKSNNYHKVFTMAVHGNKVNSLAKDYIRHIMQCHKEYIENGFKISYQYQLEILKQIDYNHLNQIDEIEDVEDLIMTPTEFCESKYLFDTDLVNYVGYS